MNSVRWRAWVILGGVAAVAIASSSCATTRQRRSVAPSGFLGSYAELRTGKENEALLVYVNPQADFSKYDAAIIDSVTIWRKTDRTDVSIEDQQHLTNRLYQAIHQAFAEHYRIVDRPGPRVLRVRAAITEVQGANVPMSVVTGAVPQARTLTMVGGLASDTAAFVGKASVEGEITDSMTNRRLFAAVDSRAGTKMPVGMFSKWSEVDDAIDLWGQRLERRLRELRERGARPGA